MACLKNDLIHIKNDSNLHWEVWFVSKQKQIDIPDN